MVRSPAPSFNPGFAEVDSDLAGAADAIGFVFTFASSIVPIM
jgi:hypothetical protein